MSGHHIHTNSADAPTVLVFDSGVGGLSILRELYHTAPHCRFIYASDNAAFPYGTKTEQDLVQRLHQVFNNLLQHFAIDVIIVACNTASTLALPHIRQHFSQPIIGVVPAIKPACLLSKTKVVGLLATPGTVARPYTKQLIADFHNGCQVISVGSSELVEVAETQLYQPNESNREASRHAIHQAINQLRCQHRGSDIDTLVLACTHFPLLKQEIQTEIRQATQKEAGTDIQLVDSGEAIARRLGYILVEQKLTQKDLQLDASATPQSIAVIIHHCRQNIDATALLPVFAPFGIKSVDTLLINS